MNLYISVVAIMLFILSFLFFCGKFLFLLGHWDTSTEEEKSKYDIKKVRKSAGFTFFTAGIATLVLACDWYKFLIGYIDFIALLILVFPIYTHTRCLK